MPSSFTRDSKAADVCSGAGTMWSNPESEHRDVPPPGRTPLDNAQGRHDQR